MERRRSEEEEGEERGSAFLWLCFKIGRNFKMRREFSHDNVSLRFVHQRPMTDLEVDDNIPFELIDEVQDVLEVDDVLELHFILVKLTSN